MGCVRYMVTVLMIVVRKCMMNIYFLTVLFEAVVRTILRLATC